MEQKDLAKKSGKGKHWKIVVLCLLVVLIAFRLVLPYIVLKYVNKTLGNIREYDGHVEDIDIALIRGAYKIKELTLVKLNPRTHQKDSIPFFTTPEIDLSVEWKALFKRRIVGEIYLEDPVLNFVKGRHKHEDVKADTTDFKEVLDKLMPLKINHFQVNNGQIHFRDPYSTPVVDIPMEHIHAEALNLSNVNDSNKLLPSSIVATGDVYGGKFTLNINLDPLKKEPTFDLNAGIDEVNIVKLNPFFKAYGKFEVNKGKFGLYTEFAGKDGDFKGYVKPLTKDIDIAQQGNFIQIIWADIIEGAVWVFKNHPKDQVATKLPIEGKFEKPETGMWTAISYLLKNAFVFALRPSIDHTIDIGKVEAPPPEKKTFLQKIFGKKDKKKKDEKGK